jgi:aspartate kinase
LAFVASREDEEKVRKAIACLEKELSFQGMKFDETMSRVSLVGAGIASSPNIAYRMFNALARAGINIDMISTSNSRISCLIPRDLMEEAVKVLHEEFIMQEVRLNEEV